MGWLIEREGLYEAHEGWAAYVTRDGRLSASSSSQGVYVEPLATAAIGAGAGPDADELVSWDDVVGWQAACACGWAGPRWERDVTLPGEYGGLDASDAYLPDGRAVDDLAQEAWAQHVEPLGRLGELRQAAREAAAARQRLDEAVAAARATAPPATWAEIGAAVGMSRQSAHERWG